MRAMMFEGQTLTIGVLASGARGVISGPLYFWRRAFEAMPPAPAWKSWKSRLSRCLPPLTADFATGQNTYDVIVNASWFYGDYISNDWIIPIDDYIGDDRFPVWEPDQVADPLRQLLQWEGQWYGVVNDGDAQLLYYRRDILEDPEWQAALRRGNRRADACPSSDMAAGSERRGVLQRQRLERRRHVR
jgi:multiple sugar transport system substrate-binding protein